MTPVEILAVAAAGLTTGAINAAVGSGSLITFLALLAVGLPPDTPNIPTGSASSWPRPAARGTTAGCWRVLAGQRRRAVVLGVTSALEAAAGEAVGGRCARRVPAPALRAVVVPIGALATVSLVP